MTGPEPRDEVALVRARREARAAMPDWCDAAPMLSPEQVEALQWAQAEAAAAMNGFADAVAASFNQLSEAMSAAMTNLRTTLGHPTVEEPPNRPQEMPDSVRRVIEARKRRGNGPPRDPRPPRHLH